MITALSTAYFAPIQYFSKLSNSEKVFLERYEHFPKQSYRNRCIIYSGNGPLNLSVPITKTNVKEYTRDIKLDYSENWVKNHCKAIESAYNNSPFFTYYNKEILSLIEKQTKYLYDFNLNIISELCLIIGIQPLIEETNEYIPTYNSEVKDFREIIHPKSRIYKPDPSFQAPVYFQVFENRFGFIENLSILDLLFNVGPDCKYLLINTLKNS